MLKLSSVSKKTAESCVFTSSEEDDIIPQWNMAGMICVWNFYLKKVFKKIKNFIKLNTTIVFLSEQPTIPIEPNFHYSDNAAQTSWDLICWSARNIEINGWIK